MIRLPAAHDLHDLAHRYGERGRLQIQNFLDAGDAERIHQMLLDTPWSIVLNEGAKVHRLSPRDLAGLSRQQISAIFGAAQVRAQTEFQFIYEYYPLFTEYFKAVSGAQSPPFEIYDFINSNEMLELFRKVSGLQEIRWADAQATLYRAGHFLKCHNDVKREERRLAAYVLNFTKDWQRDWGGVFAVLRYLRKY